MKRYKVKLLDERVIGPLEIKEVLSLIKSDELTGQEEIKEFPLGEWELLSENQTIKTIKAESPASNDETHLINLKNLIKNNEEKKPTPKPPSVTKSKPEEVNEFQFEKVDPLEEFNEQLDQQAIELEKNVTEKERSFTLPEKEEDKTIVREVKPKTVDEDKTKVNLEYKKYLENIEKEKKEEDQKKALEDAEKLKQSIKVDYENEATQVLSLEEDLKDENIILIEQEMADELLEKKIERKKIEKQKEKRLRDEDEAESEEDENASLKKKSKFVTIIAIFIILFLVLDEDEKKPNKGLSPIVITNPEIKFPIRFDLPDKEKAKELVQLGLVEESKETYPSLRAANAYYRAALENDFDNVDIAAKLIFTSSQLLKNSNKFYRHANLVFKLLQNFKDKATSNVNMATAASYFYLVIKKPKAAEKIFDIYMTLNKKKASVRLFAVHLRSLLKTGDLTSAKKIAEKLEGVKKKDLFLTESLMEYYKVQQFNKKALALLEEGLLNYPESIYLNLVKGNLFLANNNLEEVKKTILKLNKLNVEGSIYFQSKYLTLKGLYLALNDNLTEAVKDLKKALSIEESPELIQKLSLLEQSENEEINSIIVLSKSKAAIVKAKEALETGELESALKIILAARVVDPKNIELKIFLAKLQMKRGYIKDAITQLEKLYKENVSSRDTLFSLIDAYIEAHRYRKAMELLNVAQNLPDLEKEKFYGAKAKLALFKKDFNTASGWLQRAINANPMDDKYRFELAKLYITYHQYDKGKLALKQAMDLDPSNVEFNLYFAEILYEVESSSAAIGYLYDVLKDFPDSPQILSRIGIYFYRSGQLKKYKAVKKELMSLPKKHKSLFEFLIESARLDDDLDKVISYSEDLLEIDPGDLEVRMELAKNYIKKQDYKKAKNQLDSISERLDTYPKLQYLYAKLYYFVDEIEKAKELILKEIKVNPSIVEGYILYADILIKEKNLNDAKRQYLKAVQIDPRNIDAILGIAFIAFQNDQYDMALDQYQKALEVDPNKPEVYKLLGDAYRKLGQSQFAIKNYKHFLELSPNTKYKNSIQTYIRTME